MILSAPWSGRQINGSFQNQADIPIHELGDGRLPGSKRPALSVCACATRSSLRAREILGSRPGRLRSRAAVH